mgnify:FL=1
MKVYVMSGQEKDNLADRDALEWAKFGKELPVQEAFVAMTPIDIPDGCQLAVVENGTKPDFSVVKGANGASHASGIALGQEAMWDNGYRRVAQVVEVK